MTSQFRCILFALIAVPAACGGDRSTSTTSSGDALVAKRVPPAPVATPAPKVELAKIEPAKALPKAEPTAPPAPPTKASEAIAQGKLLAASGDHVGAREMFESAVKLDKKAVEPHIELARLFIATGERGLAMTAASKAVKLAPESSHAHNTLGRAELARFNYEGAIAAFQRATELNADNVWAWNNLGFTHLQLKHYEEAVDALTQATSRTGAEGYMWNNLGTAHEQLDQLDEARAAFESGGKLGSREALASRKRLEGVKTIVVTKTEFARSSGAKAATDKGYELSEPMPMIEAEHDASATEPDESMVDPDDEASEDDAPEASAPGLPSVEEKPAASSPL